MSLPTPDFLHPTRGTPWLAWVFLAACAATCAVAALDAWAAWQSRQDTQAAVALLQRPERPRAGPTRRAPDAVAPVQTLLDAPWRRRLEAVESVGMPGIAWLAIDLSHGGDLQLVGLAPDSASALQAADQLRAAGPWTQVVVTRIEPGPAPLQRFELRGTSREAER